MRTRFAFALTVASCLACASANAGGLVPGFRGMQWGDSAAKLGASTPLPKAKPTDYDCYTRATDKPAINDIPVKPIRYCFHDDKFVFLHIEFDKKFTSQMKKSVAAAYGAPNFATSDYLTWGNDKEPGGGTVSMLFNSVQMSSNDAARASAAEELAKARKDF